MFSLRIDPFLLLPILLGGRAGLRGLLKDLQMRSQVFQVSMAKRTELDTTVVDPYVAQIRRNLQEQEIWIQLRRFFHQTHALDVTDNLAQALTQLFALDVDVSSLILTLPVESSANVE